nr:hypothetical protein [Pleionea sp. CnH1-48]
MPEHPIKNFIEDWTAYHEFSHLLLPFIDLKDAWVSEGIASYYQYLVMARHGVVSEEQAFRRFWGGIKRGFDNYHRTSGRPLSEVSKNVRRYGAHRRVYWTGALLWFQADLILRKSGNSLDKVLAEFARKHHPEDDTMSARELSKVLDDIVGYPLFVPLFSQAQDLTAYPDYRELFNRIGIQIKGNELSFAPSKLRKALVTPVLESPLQMGNTERPSIQP